MSKRRYGRGSNPASQIKVAAVNIDGTGQPAHVAPDGVDRFYPTTISKREREELARRERIRRKLDAIEDCCDLGYHLAEVWDDYPDDEENEDAAA